MSRDLRVLARPAFGGPGTITYTRLLYTHLEAVGGIRVDEYSWRRLFMERYDIWHLHWPEYHLNNRRPELAVRGTATTLALLRWARTRGIKTVWTIHNLHSHEGYYPRLERMFWRDFVRLLDGYISLSHSGQEVTLDRFPELGRVPGFVIPHGHYRQDHASLPAKDAARRMLGLDPAAAVMAFVGQIRPYKNVPGLIATFRALSEPDLALLIAGYVKEPELDARVRAAAAPDPRIRLELDWLTDERLRCCVAAADVVVLPFREILNSGSAILALSCDRPVLVPEMGSLVELQGIVSPMWLRTYAGDLTPLLLREALTWARRAPRGASAPLNELGWDRIGAATLEAYRCVLAGSRR